MNIAIPVIDTNEHKFDIANGFNSTGALCLYNESSRQFAWMRISDLACNMGELLPALISKKVEGIITRHIHPMALQVLTHKGLRVYLSEGLDLVQNINLFADNKLQFCDIASSYANIQICGGECSVCFTDCNEK